jgi:hypothetical protein
LYKMNKILISKLTFKKYHFRNLKEDYTTMKV